MKQWSKNFSLLYVFLIFSCVSVVNATSSFFDDRALINHAWRHIASDLKTATGKPHFVSYTYRLAHNQPISATAKIHFKNYHKSSESQNKEFSKTLKNVERVVTVTYRSGDNKLSLIDHNPKNERKRFETRRIVGIPKTVVNV